MIEVVQLFISMVLFLVLFFGIAFILNMVLKVTWMMVLVYPIIVLLFINTTPFGEFFSNPGTAFSALWDNVTSMLLADYLLFGSGLVGIIIAGASIRYLRKSGYTMF